MTSVVDYVSAGYFLSRHTGAKDGIGISLATDHSQREFFPNAWALSWSNTSRDERLRKAAVFGIPEPELYGVIAWADESFGSAFGAWSVFFGLEEAREAARSMLGRTADLELWGVGLHRDLLKAFCEASKPPASKPGFAPIGASGVHEAACKRSAPLADGGVVLGHELLIDDLGCAFNSPESRHLEERKIPRNALGLIDSFSEALACARHLDSSAVTGWLPFLIVRYPLR